MRRGYDARGPDSSSATADRVVLEDESARLSAGTATVGVTFPTGRIRMASSSKRRQTMAKMTRERALIEKRARKQEKIEARKAAAAAPQEEPQGEEETPPVE